MKTTAMRTGLIFLATLSIGAMVSACQGTTDTNQMATDADTLSYAVGQLNGSHLREHLADYGIEEEYLNEVLKGIQEGSEASGDKERVAYYFGVLQGLGIVENTNERVFRNDDGKQLSPTIFMDGMYDGVSGKNKLPTENMAQFVERCVSKMELDYNLKKFEDNKKRNEQFMAEKAKSEDVGKLPGGVLYQVIYGGSGNMPEDTAIVTYNEEIRTIDNQQVATTYGGNPRVKRVEEVPTAIREAVRRMKAGATWEVYVPWKLVEQGKEKEKIKPFSALIYKIHVISIKKKITNN